MTPYGTSCCRMIIAALEHYDLPRTEQAIQLLCMVAAHESGRFQFVRQVNGPAMSLFQMEPETFEDVQDYAIRKHMAIVSELPSPPERLIFDSYFGAAMSRIFFMRFPELFPKGLDSLAVYAKKYWNTHLGEATANDYLRAYQRDFLNG